MTRVELFSLCMGTALAYSIALVAADPLPVRPPPSVRTFAKQLGLTPKQIETIAGIETLALEETRDKVLRELTPEQRVELENIRRSGPADPRCP